MKENTYKPQIPDIMEAIFDVAYLTFDLVAAILFFISLFPVHSAHTCKAVAYFLGAGAYFSEILLLTDCFRTRVPHSEMFMAYCFGPMYILLGISYLLGH